MSVWVKVRVMWQVMSLPFIPDASSLRLTVAGYVAPVHPGRILIEVDGVSFDIAKEALRLAAQKLPVATKFVVRRDYDPTQLV